MSTDPKQLNIDDWVQLVKLNKTGQVIEILSDKRFKIAVGSLVVTCKADEIRKVDKAKSKASPAPKKDYFQKSKDSFTIDLHGFTVTEALAAAEAAINKAIMDNYEKLEIVHGIGQGKLKTAIHKYLDTVSVVKGFSLNPQNTGTTLVFF